MFDYDTMRRCLFLLGPCARARKQLRRSAEEIGGKTATSSAAVALPTTNLCILDAAVSHPRRPYQLGSARERSSGELSPVSCLSDLAVIMCLLRKIRLNRIRSVIYHILPQALRQIG